MKNILLFGLVICLLLSCKKDIEELPEATQTGANTFGARVNGAFWVPGGKNILTTDVLEARFGGSNSVFIHARDFRAIPTEREFVIYLQGITGPGVYHLNSTTSIYPNQSASYAYYEERRFRPFAEWITDAQHTGTVTVTRYDETEKIISGTFEFTAVNLDDPSQTITVTDGRFDVEIQ
jgi:hypothetical protein